MDGFTAFRKATRTHRGFACDVASSTARRSAFLLLRVAHETTPLLLLAFRERIAPARVRILSRAQLDAYRSALQVEAIAEEIHEITSICLAHAIRLRAVDDDD